MRLFVVDVIDSDEVELTDVTFHTVSKAMDGGGVAMFSIRDYENAQITAWTRLLWEMIEIRKNDGTSVLWEGFINNVTIDRNRVTFSAIEGLRALDDVPCEYSSIEAEGTVTAVSGAVVTDANANHTVDALIGKYCKFTDVDAPSNEENWPNNSTVFVGSGDSESGTYTDLTSSSGSMRTKDADDTSPTGADKYGIEVVWTVANFATATKVVIDLLVVCHPYYVWADISDATYYPNEDERPLISLYDYNASAYVTSKAGVTGIGRFTAPWGTVHARQIVITTDVDHYFSGGTMKIKITDGDPQKNFEKPAAPKRYYMGLYWALNTTTYSVLFNAEDTVYTVDDNTATTLTFTGQNPETDGVATGDMYVVGETLSTIMAAIFNASGVNNWMSLTMAATTDIDGTDYSHNYIGDIIQRFADRLGRKVWQSTGWTVNVGSSFTDTSIDLTDADIITSVDKSGWTYNANGRNIIRKAIVTGGGGTATSYSNGTYGTPQAVIANDPLIRDQASAKAIADALVTRNDDPVITMDITIDCDSSITNIANLDLGKTIDINLFSSTIVISQGVITYLEYLQNKGEHLKARMTVEVI